MRLLLLLPLLFFGNFSSAQVVQKAYQNGQVNDIQLTQDGGVVLTGVMKTNSNDKCYLMKFDSAGQVSWLNSYADLLEFYSYGVKVIEVPQDGYLCGGVMFHDTISNEEFTLLKCDNAGNLLWVREFGNPFDDDELTSMILFNGSILLAGHTTAMGPGGEDFLLIKTDSLGNNPQMKSFGNTYDERCAKIITYQNGFVAGGFGFTGSDNDLFLLYLDSALNILNTLQINIPGNQRMYDLIEGASGDLLIAATNDSALNYPKALILKINSSGSGIWCKEINEEYSIPYKLQLSSNGIRIAGASMKNVFRENAFLMELDHSGNILNENYFGDSTGCLFKSFFVQNDTMQLAGNYTKSGALFPSVYLNKYYPGDTTCNHFTRTSTLSDIFPNISSVNWQGIDQSTPLISPVVLGIAANGNDTLLCDLNPSTGELQKVKSFTMLPNPADNVVTIIVPDEFVKAGLTIYNSSGVSVLNGSCVIGKNILSINDLIPGIYMVELLNKSTRISQRLLIQR